MSRGFSRSISEGNFDSIDQVIVGWKEKLYRYLSTAPPTISDMTSESPGSMDKADQSDQPVFSVGVSNEGSEVVPPADGNPIRKLTTSMSTVELELLAQLHAANKALESDTKSVHAVATDGAIERPNSTTESNNNSKSPVSQADSISLKSTSSLKSQLSSSHGTGDCDSEPDTSIEQARRESVTSWGKLLNDWNYVMKKRTQHVRELVYKGVPKEFRCLAWQYLCGAENCTVAKEKYSRYLKQTSACEKVIRRDIARTYPEHEFFQESGGMGQESLFNVMKAYSLHDREVGYCQGSCFIVGLLLMTMPEEEAFAVLCQLMAEYRLRLLYKPAMFELGVCMYQLEYLIQEQLPMLYQHFQAQCFHTSMYASGWFLTLFTTQLPLDVCFRIMDMFLLDGMEVIFRVGVAILMLGESDLLCLDMEGMLNYFQDTFTSLYDDDVEVLLDTAANKVKYNTKKMKKLEKEYSLLKMKENEDQVEMRRLRSENRLLRQRIDNLEKENVTLADRLIQGQVSRAQEAEVMFGVKRELSQLREQNKELKRSLSASEQQIVQLNQTSHTIARKMQRSISVPSADDGLLRHVQTLHAALNDLHRSSLTTVASECSDEQSERFQALQEELIAVKLREAESNLALRELANHVAVLDSEWQKRQERTPNDKLSRSASQSLQDELMSSRLRESQSSANFTQVSLKLTEIETNGQLLSNKMERLLEENENLRASVSTQKEEKATLKFELDELKNNLDNCRSKTAEDDMTSKINSVEHSALVAELRTRIAELEVKNQEFITAAEIAPGLPRSPRPPVSATADNPAALLRQKSTTGNDILNLSLSRNSLSFSTLDIKKGDFNDSDGSDGDHTPETDLTSPNKYDDTNHTPNGPSRRLTMMEMDRETDSGDDDDDMPIQMRSDLTNGQVETGSTVDETEQMTSTELDS